MNGGQDAGTDCAELYELLDAYVDGELSPDECERLKAHLVQCPSCLGEYQRDTLLKALVRRSCQCESAPSTLRAQILTRISTVVSDGRSVRATSVTTVTDAD